MEAETTVALTGNTYIAQPIAGYRNPRFLRVAEYLRDAGVVLTNLECSIPDPETPPEYVAGTGWGATYMIGKPSLLEDLRFLGINGICAANNHISDFGEAGILATVRRLEEAGIRYAGIGASLTEASQAAYLDTPAGLRVAFLAVCDWGPRGAQGLNFPWPVGYLPADEMPPFRPRPGVNLLRYEVVSHVTRERLEQLRAMSAELGWEQDKIFRRNGFERGHPLVGMTTNLGVELDTEDTLYFLGRCFQADSAPGHHTVACTEDLERMYKHIREARRQADIVCVALHDQSHGERVHEYISTFAHGAIDADADVYFNNGGSHMGIEIYKGKAILYGIPSFFLQTEAVVNVPVDALLRYGMAPGSTAADFLDKRAAGAARAFEEGGEMGRMRQGGRGSAVHLCVFDSRARLKEIRIQPLEPMGGTIFAGDQEVPVPRFRRALPLMPEAGSPVAARVLQHAAEAAQPFGTEIAVRDGIGIVSLG